MLCIASSSALKVGLSYENCEAKKKLDREHRVPRQVLAVELLLENASVIMITVGFVIASLGRVQMPANSSRQIGGAFDPPQDGKAAGSRCLLCSAHTSLCAARRMRPISLFRAPKLGFWGMAHGGIPS